MSQFKTKRGRSSGYIDKVLALPKPPVGTLQHVIVAHDADCPKYLGTGPCQCDPDVSLCGTFSP